MPKKILIVDDEPIFIQPIFDRVKLEFGEDIDLHYFERVHDVLAYIETKGLNGVSGIVLDLMLNLSTDFRKEIALGGQVIARRVREINDDIPIAYFSLLSRNESAIIECLSIPNTIFISKGDSDGMEKLINFISEIL